MIRRFVSLVKEVLVKLRLLKELKSVMDHKDIYVNEEMYQSIDKWRCLYKGYWEGMHDVEYFTIENGKSVRRMHTLNMPKTVSEEMASLVFNEKCNISITTKGNEGAEEDLLDTFIHEVLKQNKFNKLFQDYLEYSFAFGGMVIKPYVEDNQIKLSFITADCFIPITYSNEAITEGVFINEWRKGKNKYTHLEWHLWEKETYIIRNEVYKSENGNDLGIKIPIKTVYPNLEEEVEIVGLSRPLFAYFKPNIANNIDTQSPLGISLFANAIDTLKAIDTAFDSFEREFRLGKKRIIVPSYAIKTVIDPQTGEVKRYFDANDEAYESFTFDEQDGNGMQDISMELRVEEHVAAINAMLNIYAMQTGFSAGTFSFDGESMKTATEVVSENSKTFKSKKAHETVIEASLQELIHSILELSELYGIFNAPDDYDIVVGFDDSIVEDKAAELTSLIQEITNGLTPKKRAIMKYHDLTEDEAEQWMKEMKQEQIDSMPERDEIIQSTTMFGSEE